MTRGQDKPTGILLAFDFGERRIGVASGSRIGGTATALTTLRARAGKPDWEELDRILREWEPDILVVGLPYNIDGSDSVMTPRAREFADCLADRYGRPVDMVDERLTSREASARLKEQRQQGRRPGKVRPEDVDCVAAQIIAESWLSTAGTNNGNDGT